MNNQEKFEKLREKLKELHYYSGLMNLAVWDQQVYLPAGAATGRGEQVGFLAKQRHEKANDPALFELVQELSSTSDLTSDERVVVSETLYDLKKEQKKPSALVQAMADAEITTHTLWLEARAAKEFSVVQTKLQTLIARITEGNQHSIYLHEVNGFMHVGVLKKVGQKFGKLLDVTMMQKVFPEKN